MKRITFNLVLTAACAIAALSRASAADLNPPPIFQEAFSFPLGDYWCENHLSVADMDGDGRKDIVLMATGLASTNGPPWQYRCRAILLHAEPDGSFTASVITNFPGRYGYAAVAADLNNDSATDLILREQSATHVLLNDNNPGIRTQAIDLLVQHKQRDVVGALQQLMQREDNDYIRQRTQRLLRDLNASVDSF